MSRCRSIPITVANRYAKVSIDTYCLTNRYVKFCRPIYIAKTSRYLYNIPFFLSLFLFLFFLLTLYSPASGQAVVTGVVPSPPRCLPSVFVAHRVQQSHWSSTFHRVLLTHALALSASQFVRKKKSQRILYEYALGGARTHETDLYQARG